jgi:hypothetical protein
LNEVLDFCNDLEISLDGKMNQVVAQLIMQIKRAGQGQVPNGLNETFDD